MDTSRSREWKATAQVFSGRPDPEWEIEEASVVELLAAWSAMEPGNGPEHAPPLGYRGVMMRAPDGRRWSAYAGVVSMESESRTDHRVDPGRSFEAQLLASAPPELLPPIDLAAGGPPPSPGGRQ